MIALHVLGTFVADEGFQRRSRRRSAETSKSLAPLPLLALVASDITPERVRHFALFVIFNRALVCTAFTVAGCPGVLRAQFTDPGTYTNSPVGINQLTLGYGLTRANASIDPSLVIPEAKLWSMGRGNRSGLILRPS